MTEHTLKMVLENEQEYEVDVDVDWCAAEPDVGLMSDYPGEIRIVAVRELRHISGLGKDTKYEWTDVPKDQGQFGSIWDALNDRVDSAMEDVEAPEPYYPED